MKYDLTIKGFFFRRFPSRKIAEMYVSFQAHDVQLACLIVPAPTAAAGKAQLDPGPGAGSPTRAGR